jgi:hypothetical protein
MYDASQQGPMQGRNWGAFIEFGPIDLDMPMATVLVMFYAGCRGARWIRFRVEQVDGARLVASANVLAVS